MSAAAAAAAIVAGWGVAQKPDLLPGLSIHEAAAGRSTIVAMVVALALGVPALLAFVWLGFVWLAPSITTADER